MNLRQNLSNMSLQNQIANDVCGLLVSKTINVFFFLSPIFNDAVVLVLLFVLGFNFFVKVALIYRKCPSHLTKFT